jgi:nucleoside-diphosphate-sugar epimerase
MRIALTGATGLLGRNLLYEFIKQHIDRLDDLAIVVLGRDKASQPIGDRVQAMVMEDGIPYLSVRGSQVDEIRDFIKSKVAFVDMDLGQDALGISSDAFGKLKSAQIDCFFHMAASTAFSDSQEASDFLVQTNVQGTARVLELASQLNIGELCYIGTAYCFRKASGVVKPDYIDDVESSDGWRSVYERSKLQAEIQVRNLARNHRMRCRYFRPTFLCGRLIEEPLGAISKFEGLYAWAGYFLRLKMKALRDCTDKYGTTARLDMRILYNPKSTFNMTPVDYAAKVIYQVCTQGHPGDSYHVANGQAASHTMFLPAMLEALGIEGVSLVEQMPEDLNRMELLYYRTVGKAFGPFMTIEPVVFDVNNLLEVLHNARLSCPAVDRKNFDVLMEYAKKRDFGLK